MRASARVYKGAIMKRIVKFAIFAAAAAAVLAAVGTYSAHKATRAQLEEARATVNK